MDALVPKRRETISQLQNNKFITIGSDVSGTSLMKDDYVDNGLENFLEIPFL